jgi:hypothetical protein
MKFTKQFEDYNDIKKFMKKEDIHYLFDCTGGRLKNSPNEIIKWNKYKFIKDNQEVKYNNDSKYFELLEDNKLFTKTIFVLELLDKNKKQILVGNAFGFVTEESDHEILNKYRNMCFLKKDYITLSKHFIAAANGLMQSPHSNNPNCSLLNNGNKFIFSIGIHP